LSTFVYNLTHMARFETGSIQAHKDASEEWVKDVGPVVESYIGVYHVYTIGGFV